MDATATPTATPTPTTLELARAWADMDPNESTKQYVMSLVERSESQSESQSQAQQELEALFPSDGSRIGFGTAGLRSAMKPGPLNMNDLVIVQTTQGLARYCQQIAKENERDNEKLVAVIGYDHRSNPDLNLSSHRFAMLTKLAFLEAGFDECILFSGYGNGYCATPHVAYGVTKCNAAVGVMVTASHNPKDDAGFKVYWSDGCQIRSPVDEGIAKCILEQDNLNPWIDYGLALKDRIEGMCSDGNGNGDINSSYGLGNVDATKEVIDDYYRAIASSGLVISDDDDETKNEHAQEKAPKICYTAMHGIGHKWAVKSFETFGLEPFASVPEQQEPDYLFSTVPFPNPEENGALDKAMEFAEMSGCDLILANDPDADRLAVAERCRKTGEWTTFTGDQIGTMLGLRIWNTIGKSCGKVSFRFLLLLSCSSPSFVLIDVIVTINFCTYASHHHFFSSNSRSQCVHQQYLPRCWQELRM